MKRFHAPSIDCHCDFDRVRASADAHNISFGVTSIVTHPFIHHNHLTEIISVEAERLQSMAPIYIRRSK